MKDEVVGFILHLTCDSIVISKFQIFIVHDNGRGGVERISPDAIFIHEQGDLVWGEKELKILCFNKFQN